MIQRRTQMTISLPNILTLVRILLTPLFIILLLKDLYSLALLIFTIAGISDALDGFIARYFNQRTVLGAYLDPVADKLLLISSFICLSVLQIIPAWVAVIVITRDVIIVIGIAIFTITEKEYEVKPSIISKFTTTAQITTVIVCLLKVTITGVGGVHYLLLWITAGLTTFSGLHYIYIGMNILQDTDGKHSQE